MQAIMETIFDIAYLITVILLGVLTLRAAKGRKQFQLFGIMAIVLGCGDAFHLVPRIWALNTTGVSNYAAMLGFGTLITSITMTVFYVMLYHVWRLRYSVKGKNGLTASIYGLALLRIIICFFPQNDWFSADAPLAWGIYRNIPFIIMGAVIIFLFFTKTREYKGRAYRFMWLAIKISFICYIPVVLFADKVPVIGALMIPKTCAYVWVVLMGYNDSKASTFNRTLK